MDLGIQGRRALVCAASKGLGRACAESLAREGVLVTITSRDRDALARCAEEIGAITGAHVSIAPGDIASEAGRSAALAICPEPDILVTNAGGPPVGRFESFCHADWTAALESNMLAPIALIRTVYPGMRSRKFGRVINITSAMVKAPTEALPLSVGARAGLSAAVSWIAREGVVDNVTINSLLPEMIMTDRARSGVDRMAQLACRDPEKFMADLLSKLPARRMGKPAELGGLCAFLCSVHAGYITNQHILVDGGNYPGLF
jgi:3-oxoacyl-[acyl-carrier protein] reductase